MEGTPRRFSWALVAFAVGSACNSGSAVSGTNRLDSVSPSWGATAGGTQVTLSGSWAADWTSVELRDPVTGAVEGTPSGLLNSRNSALVYMPPHAAGLVDLVLLRGDNRLFGSFVYEPSTWSAFGPNAAESGWNFDAARFATSACAVGSGVDGGQVVVWREDNGTATQLRAAHVASDGTRTWLDGGGTTGLNHDVTMSVEKPCVLRQSVYFGIAPSTATFVAWTERHPTRNTYQVRVKQWNESLTSPAWTSIDGGAADGLNRDPAFDADDVQLGVTGGLLRAVWTEQNVSSASKVQVALWESVTGSPEWSLDEDGGINGLSFHPTEVTYHARILPAHGALVESVTHVAWIETSSGVGHVRVARKHSSSSTWQFVDGNTANGLNRDPTKDATACTLFSDGTFVYCAFVEADAAGVYQLHVARWNSDVSAPVWTFLGSVANEGLNFDSTRDAANPSGVFLGRRLYLAWRENSGGNFYARVAGVTATAREFLGTSTIGINDTTGNDSLAVRAFVADNQLHVLRTQANSSGVYQVRVAKGN